MTMKKLSKRLMALALVLIMAISLVACGSSDEPSGGNAGIPDSGNAGNPSSDGIPTITFYPRDANVASGVVGGYKGEYFASRGFNLEVWAYSDEKTNAMLSSGDLPDVLFIPETSLDIMIQNGSLLNLDDYLEQMPHLMAYEEAEAALNYAREFKSAGTGSVYGIPTSIGRNFAANKYVDSMERNAVKIHWEHYVGIGAPEINDFYDLIDVMEQMQKAYPTDSDGNNFYGTVLNNGSDTTHWACMTMWYRMQGYEETQLPYLLETNMVDGTYSSILDKDSMYYQGLKWYNEIYKRGLMDPDSINNDRATQKPKVDNGFAQIPSGYLPGWASTYLEYYIPGTQLYYNPNSTYGDARYMIGINAKTQNLDACLAYLDMLADPDAYLWISAGPEGDFWTTDGSGNAVLTEKAIAHLDSGAADTTGFVLDNGEELVLWNTPFIAWNGALTSYGDGEGGKRTAAVGGWSELNERTIQNETFESWKEISGYDTFKELLQAKGALHETSPLDNVKDFTSQPDDMMQLTIDAIRDKITTASWKMVYAENDSDFDALWNQMISDCEGLDAQSIIDWRLADLENAKNIRDSLK